MKKKIRTACMLFFIFYSVFFFFAYSISLPKQEDLSDAIIQVNEIQNEFDKGTLQAESIHSLQSQLEAHHEQNYTQSVLPWLLLYGGSVLFLLLIYSYLSHAILKPFAKLQGYANEIAKGNFDIPLQDQRSQIFGAFTWAFDNLRFELKKAKESEKEAIENSKTVIASLSHDIKTPISSIRACSEALVKGMDTTEERRERYLHTIIKKCDEVSVLSNDLFLHSLQDMEALQYHNNWVELQPCIMEVQTAFQQEHQNRIHVPENLHELQGVFYIDSKRFVQVMENVCQNAIKYTKGEIFITYHIEDSSFIIQIQDEGQGIKDEDMPFLFEKFYRGKGVAQIPGAGLGLYLVKQMMENMKGDVSLCNTKQGLLVTLTFQRKDCSLKTS